MRASPIVAALAVVAMTSGCATYAESRKAANVGGVMTLVGIAVTALAFERSTDATGQLALGLLSISVGATLGVGGLLGVLAYDKNPSKRPPPADPAQRNPAAEALPENNDPAVPHAGHKPEVVELHERALGATLRGDCTTVLLIAGRVQQIDSEYYEADFVISPAIKACLPVTPETTP